LRIERATSSTLLITKTNCARRAEEDLSPQEWRRKKETKMEIWKTRIRKKKRRILLKNKNSMKTTMTLEKISKTMRISEKMQKTN